ncbi:MAG: hypothetical protein M3R04_01200 [bacterium]|nr:hypothetical protein [bacterium]
MRHMEEDILKAELDFGDGTGWQDCTVDCLTTWFREPYVPNQVPIDWMTRHTYTEPGTYEINGRITFWDGEVMNIDADEMYPIAVLP